jgi:hypothetical protein
MMIATYASGRIIGKKNVDNFRSTSMKYQNMDQQVRNLDNTFKALPTATQGPWNGIAFEFFLVNICGCDQPIANGQELFRSVNFIRLKLGEAIIDTAPTTWPTEPPAFGPFIWHSTAVPPFLEFSVPGDYEPGYMIINLGHGLDNPLFNITDGLYYSGDPLYDFLTAGPLGALYYCCIWDAYRSPWASGAQEYYAE